MKCKKLCRAIAVLAAIALLPGAALAAGTKVSVRVEGLTKTLLKTTSVKTHAGEITKDGTPKGQCSATTAAGALGRATKGRWGGAYTKTYGLELTSILGETHTFSSPSFWEVFVDHKPASVGICAQTLKRGDSLVFAAVPVKGMHYLTGIRAPHTATVGHAFKVTVVVYDAKGHAKPLARAPLRFGKVAVVTNRHGSARIMPTFAGRVTLYSAAKGEIRAAPVTVRVTG